MHGAKRVLPPGVPRVAVEAGVRAFWRQYVGLEGGVVGIDSFGESAPAAALFEHFALTAQAVADEARRVVQRFASHERHNESNRFVPEEFAMAFIALRQLLDHAAEHGYGVPAFNVNNMEQIHAIVQAAEETASPVILQASAGRAQVCGRAVSAASGARRARGASRTFRSCCIRITARVRPCVSRQSARALHR